MLSQLIEANELTIKIANGEWFPYTSQYQENNGVFSEIVTKAFASQGIQVKYEFFPWARAFKVTKSGEFEASITWAKKKEWKPFFEYSDAVLESRKVLFFNQTRSFSWHQYSDLIDKKVAIINSYTYGEEFDRFAKEHQDAVQQLVREEQALKMLLLGRVDAFASDIIVGYAYTDKLFNPAFKKMITHHEKSLDITPLHVIFSKNLPDNRRKFLLDKFNKGLRYLKSSGQFEKIKLKSMLPTNYLEGAFSQYCDNT